MFLEYDWVLGVESGQFEARPSPLAWEVDGGVCTIPPLFAWGANKTQDASFLLRRRYLLKVLQFSFACSVYFNVFPLCTVTFAFADFQSYQDIVTVYCHCVLLIESYLTTYANTHIDKRPSLCFLVGRLSAIIQTR